MNYRAPIGLLALLLGLPFLLTAQSYIEQQTQHRFAQTYIGINAQLMPESGTFLWENQQTPFPAMAIPRFTIGGLHFWGHLDFKINFALTHLGDFSIDAITELLLRPGGDFSARYYPWRVQYRRIRPFLGVSLNQMILSVDSDRLGYRGDLLIGLSPVAGFSYAFKDWQLNVEARWRPDHRVDFYTNRLTASTIQLPPVYYSFGLVKYFDVTIKEEKRLQSGETTRIEQALKGIGRLNSFSIGIAPSVAYFFHAPSYQQPERQSVPRHKAEMNWDFGIGYLFHNAGWHIGISFRDYTSDSESYELDHLYRRTSWALEGYKFFWDYNGFVPFVGASISREKWAAAEFDKGIQTGETQSTRLISPGIILGWDILPSPLETWTLRTNLRYYPFQRINDITGQKSRVDQFEFNFIQFVLYPNRLVNVSRERKKR